MWNVAERETVVYGLHLGDHLYRYIGISCKLGSRFSHHKTNARDGMDLPVYRWMRKHGLDVIRVEILSIHPTREAACAEEVRLIADLRPQLLNITAGGDGGLGVPRTPEQKRAQSERQRGRPHPNPPSAEHMARITELARLVPMSQNEREKRRQRFAEMNRTPEQREISSTRMASRHAELHAAGLPSPGHTPEAKAKRAETMKRIWAERRAAKE